MEGRKEERERERERLEGETQKTSAARMRAEGGLDLSLCVEEERERENHFGSSHLPASPSQRGGGGSATALWAWGGFLPSPGGGRLLERGWLETNRRSCLAAVANTGGSERSHRAQRKECNPSGTAARIDRRRPQECKRGRPKDRGSAISSRLHRKHDPPEQVPRALLRVEDNRQEGRREQCPALLYFNGAAPERRKT